MKYLFCGLGNIGTEYVDTRHNLGFMVVDLLSKTLNFSFNLNKMAYIGETQYKGRTIYCIKPTTYMNESGKAIRYWLSLLQIPTENLLVITDDLSIPFGKIRLRSKGSSGGHNGLSSIQQAINTQSYPRMRIGIGNNFEKGHQAEYVLGKFSKEEAQQLPQVLSKSVEACLCFCTIGIEHTMNIFNK